MCTKAFSSFHSWLALSRCLTCSFLICRTVPHFPLRSARRLSWRWLRSLTTSNPPPRSATFSFRYTRALYPIKPFISLFKSAIIANDN